MPAKFYKHDSQSGYTFKSVQAAYLGAAIAGVIGTGYWAVMTAAIITAFQIAIQNLTKGFGLYPTVAFISFVAVAGVAIGIVFRMTRFYHLPTIYNDDNLINFAEIKSHRFFLNLISCFTFNCQEVFS